MLIHSNQDFLQAVRGAEWIVGAEVAGFRGACTAQTERTDKPQQCRQPVTMRRWHNLSCGFAWVICWTAQRPFFPSPVWEKTNLRTQCLKGDNKGGGEWGSQNLQDVSGSRLFCLDHISITSNSWFTSAWCSTSKSAAHRLMLGAICKGFWEKSMLCPLQMRGFFFFPSDYYFTFWASTSTRQ